MKGRSEINLVRLLAQSEEMITWKKQQEDWRLKTYIERLEELLQETEKCDRKPFEEDMKDYRKRIGFLKEFLVAKSLPTAAEKAFANQRLIPAKSQAISSLGATSTGQQIKQVAAAQYSKEMKKDLFAKESLGNTAEENLRHRSAVTTSRDIDEALKFQQDQHDRIAEDMIALTRNLKHNISASGKIIRDDTKVLHEASKKAERNVTQLKHESNRLESRLRKGTNWWLWIALAAVCATFLFMIFFIRFFPKLR